MLSSMLLLNSLLDTMQETEYREQFESMQQAAGVSSILDLVQACVNAETVNFELLIYVARLMDCLSTHGAKCAQGLVASEQPA